MNRARSQHTATLLQDGTVLLIGGVPGNEAFSSTEIFDPSTESFIAGPNLLLRRVLHAATLLPDGRVLVTGGYQSEARGQPLQSAELFDPREHHRLRSLRGGID